MASETKVNSAFDSCSEIFEKKCSISHGNEIFLFNRKMTFDKYKNEHQDIAYLKRN